MATADKSFERGATSRGSRYSYLGLEKRGNFTTTSLYKELTFPGMANRELMSIWKARIPMKIKFFLWSIYSDCLPSAEQLVKRNWPGDEKCKMCGQLEMSQHIFFECFLANFCWWTYRDALSWTLTPNLQQFLIFIHGRGEVPNSRMIFLLACVCWSCGSFEMSMFSVIEWFRILMLWSTAHLFSCRNGAFFSRRRKRTGF